MTLTKRRASPPQLNEASLRELAIAYVAKYATSRARFAAYLARKLRERGWSDDQQPDIDALATRFSELGYIDDSAYALSRARSLSARGYGKRRLADRLRLDGVAESDRAAADAHADDEALEAALRFASRRRLGPFAAAPGGPPERAKWVAAMVRAGHAFTLSRAIAAIRPGDEIDRDALKQQQ